MWATHLTKGWHFLPGCGCWGIPRMLFTEARTFWRCVVLKQAHKCYGELLSQKELITWCERRWWGMFYSAWRTIIFQPFTLIHAHSMPACILECVWLALAWHTRSHSLCSLTLLLALPVPTLPPHLTPSHKLSPAQFIFRSQRARGDLKQFQGGWEADQYSDGI